MNWITNLVPPKVRSFLKRESPDNLWIKCPESGQLVFHKEVEDNLMVIPGSEHHLRMGTKERLAHMFDGGQYEIVPLPENFLEAVRNLPKPAPQRKGPSQSPAQQAKRAEGQRRYQEGQKAQRGAPDKARRGEGGHRGEGAHRGEGDGAGAKKNFRRRRGGGGGAVGTHKGAVQRTGAPRG